jgi:hypothetical protein
MRVKVIKHCRICGTGEFRELFDLGELHSCGVFPRANEPDPPALPLNVIQCTGCGLVQLSHDFETEDLFRSTYGYRSGLNESMVRHLSGLVAAAQSCVALRSGDVVLDIGSNDGTLLSSYDVPDVVRIGIDPTIARFHKYYPAGIVTLDEFFTEQNFRRVHASGSARIVTSISMFYDLPAPNDFVRDIRSIMADDGVWILEQSYLPTMVDRNSFDTICHEHVEYYSLRQIMDLTTRNGLRVFDVALNDVNGGSFQVWVCRNDAGYRSNSAAIAQLLDNEENQGYAKGGPVLELKARVHQTRERVLAFLQDCRRSGKLVHGYGASTKGNTLLQFFGITPELLPAVAERNSEKFGCRTPGTGIPIISEAESRSLKPDFYFALPWHFRESFLMRETEFLDRGGRFIFPLPSFEVFPALSG